mmetsp:Transcript_12345/g.34216  ORF Transcript_12345/g.34216 Transcript_12345/m.34216 type:complete len:276 (+) Transcript_12345:57-884(+)
MEALLRKVPPADLPKILNGLDTDTKAQLEKSFPAPFSVCEFEDDVDDEEKPFIMCPSNRVAPGEYRSPWSNKVFKADGKEGTSKTNQNDKSLLEIETKFNNVWAAYARLYYGSEAVSSVYLGETESKQFLGVFCIHKSCDEGLWNGYHIVQMDDPKEGSCRYHVSSTVLAVVNPEHELKDTSVEFSSFLTKQTSKVMKIEKFSMDEYHLQNIGSLVEANEIDIRTQLEQVHMPKTKEVMDTIQKEPEAPREMNPLMGLIMDSTVLKKKQMGEGLS